jgi:hypothetical protein
MGQSYWTNEGKSLSLNYEITLFVLGNCCLEIFTLAVLEKRYSGTASGVSFN